jgi:hypothetical protein
MGRGPDAAQELASLSAQLSPLTSLLLSSPRRFNSITHYYPEPLLKPFPTAHLTLPLPTFLIHLRATLTANSKSFYTSASAMHGCHLVAAGRSGRVALPVKALKARRTRRLAWWSGRPSSACSQADRAHQSWYAGRASGRVLSGAWLPAQRYLRRGRSRWSSRRTSFLARAAVAGRGAWHIQLRSYPFVTISARELSGVGLG